MASWVITISKDFPQHWDYAREHGVWDMSKGHKVRAGDLVYFRFGGGGGLIGQTRATSDFRPLVASDEVPWDDGRDPYTARFELELLADTPLRPDTWATISSRLTKNPIMQAPRSWDDPSDEAVLASYFLLGSVGRSPMEELAGSLLAGEVDEEEFDTDMSDDEKKFAKVVRVVRQGQDAFRDHLYDLYQGCAITGTTVKEALDAAHIKPYTGPKSNIPPNGMPLRSDLHRLFDRHLITVTLDATGTYRVQVSPTLQESPYADLDGQELSALPSNSKLRPHVDFLAEHHEDCDWLAP